MAQSSQNNTGIISGINVTPLVDITLVLLVIFIVTAKIIVTPAVPLDLPRTSEGQSVQMVFSVLLPKDGRTLINGAPVASDANFEERAREALKENAQLRAVIQADGDVRHRRVVATLDLLKRAGISKIAFGALPEEQ